MLKKTLSDVYSIPSSELINHTKLNLSIVDTPEETFFDFALAFLKEVVKNNKAKKKTVAIMPCGPTEPYSIMTRLINEERIDCTNVVMINMDEYCTEDGKHLIDTSSGLSFKKFMYENFYDKIDPSLNVKEENRIFPDPQSPEDIPKLIDALGGVDLCLCSLGYTGHLAFNDPPEADDVISDEEFKNLPTRVITLARESLVQNSLKYGGNKDIIPTKAITVGMKELLEARKIVVYFMRDWQAAIFRKALFGPITAQVPGSFLQEHTNVKVVVSKNVTKCPIADISATY